MVTASKRVVEIQGTGEEEITAVTMIPLCPQTEAAEMRTQTTPVAVGTQARIGMTLSRKMIAVTKG